MSIGDPFIIGDGDGTDGTTSVATITPTRPPRRGLRIALAVVTVLAVGGGFAAWRFVSGFGSATESASAMPADADVYVNLDLATFLDGDQMQRIADTFPEAFEGLDPSDDALGSLDAIYEEELGITFTDDVVPWLGRSIGVAMWDLDPLGLEEPGFVAAVKVRDGEAADLFLERLATANAGGTVGTTQGAPVWEIDIDGEVAYAARADDMLIFGPTQADLVIGVETQAGVRPSLESDPTYLETVAAVPNGAGNLIAYFNGDVFDEVASDPYALGLTGTQLEQFEGFRSAILSLAITDDGIRIDGASLVDSQFADAYAGPGVEAIRPLPADALFFLASDYSAATEAYRDMLEDPELTGGVDVESEIGFDPVTEFLDLLTGELAVYGRPGAVRGPEGFDLGIGAYLGLTDPIAMEETLGKIDEMVSELVPVSVDGTRRSVDIGDGSPPAGYGIDGNRMALGWNTDPFADLAGTSSIVENPAYTELRDAVGGDLMVFVDIPSLAEIFVDPGDETWDAIRPIGSFGATTAASDGVVTGSALLRIDWAD